MDESSTILINLDSIKMVAVKKECLEIMFKNSGSYNISIPTHYVNTILKYKAGSQQFLQVDYPTDKINH